MACLAKLCDSNTFPSNSFIKCSKTTHQCSSNDYKASLSSHYSGSQDKNILYLFAFSCHNHLIKEEKASGVLDTWMATLHNASASDFQKCITENPYIWWNIIKDKDC
jgi:hypothetical protein